MRNTKFIIASVSIALLLIIAIAVTYLFGGKSENPVVEEDPFGTVLNRPNGVGADDPTTTVTDTFYTDTATVGTNTEAPALRLISDKPVSGATTFTKGNKAYVRYVDTATGNILDTPLRTIVPSVARSTDTNLRVGNVLWSDDADTIMLQRLDTEGLSLYSYIGSFTASTSDEGSATQGRFNGRHLNDDILTAAVAPDGSSIFYTEKTSEGSVGFLETIHVGTREVVWTSPLTGIHAVWDTDNTILLYTKPTSLGNGFVWLLDPHTKKSTLILGNENALAAKISPAGDKILYSYKELESSLTTLRVLDIASGEVATLPHPTIVEKCAWGKKHSPHVYCAIPKEISNVNFMEDWYYGIEQSDDTLWQMNVETYTSEKLLSPVDETSETFDMMDVTVSPDEEYVLFRTRENTLLWAAAIPALLQPKTTSTPVEE